MLAAQRKPHENDRRQLQGVFKVQGFKRINLNPMLSGDGSGQDALASIRPRKSHRKSRTGCSNCKSRRVKCDEARQGGCLKCRHHGIDCDYLLSQPDLGRGLVQNHAKIPDSSGHDAETQPHSIMSQSASDVLDWNDDALCAFSVSPSPNSQLLRATFDLLPNTCPQITSPLASLHHFEIFTSYTCGSPQGQSIIQSCVISLAGQTPYLMHAMLGISAAHMSYLLTPEVNAVQHARNKAAEAWHWGHALALFRKELGGEDSTGAGRGNMDALISTIMLVAIHQFMLRDEDDQPSVNNGSESWKRSFVLMEDDNDRHNAMKWLTIQSGFRLLLRQLDRYLAQSVWLPVLEDSSIDQRFHTLTNADDTKDEIETLLCEICNIDSDSTPENNIYFNTLETVLFVRQLRPVRVEVFNKLITVMGRITPELKHLIWSRDPAALLILCHWLSMMAELKQWWLETRSLRECRAIVVYLLAQKFDDETTYRVRRILTEPANIVGILV